MTFDVGDWGVVDPLDGVRGEALVGSIPQAGALETQFGVEHFVIHVLFEPVVSAVHPCDVRVSLLVDTNRRVERVGVVNGHACVVDNHQVAFGAKSRVLHVHAT